MISKSAYHCMLVDAMSMKTKVGSLSLVMIIIGAFLGPTGKMIICLFTVSQLALLFMYDEKGLKALLFLPANKKSAVTGRFVFAAGVMLVCFAAFLIADLLAPIVLSEYTGGTLSFYCILLSPANGQD